MLRWHAYLLSFASLALLFCHLFILTGSVSLHLICNVSSVNEQWNQVSLESRTEATPFTRMMSLSLSLIHLTRFADTCDGAPLFRVIVNLLLICPVVCLNIYLSSSISRLDSLSDSCLQSASLRSISLWSFLCSRMFSSLMCRSSSMYWARFSVSGKGNTQNRLHQLSYCQAYILATVYHHDQQIN